MRGSRVLEIRARLLRAFAPSELEVIDETHLHEGHEGAKDGKGHFKVTIVSEHFAGCEPLECHRMVFAALGTLMETDIHALRVSARSKSRKFH